MPGNSEHEGGLATASSSVKACELCQKGKAEIPISDNEGVSLEICEGCDKRMFEIDLAEVEGIILEALADYQRWWEGDDEPDKEKREQIERAIEAVKGCRNKNGE